MSRRRKAAPLDNDERDVLRRVAFLNAMDLSHGTEKIKGLLLSADQLARHLERHDDGMRDFANAIDEALKKAPEHTARFLDALGVETEDLDYIDPLRYDRLRAREKGQHWDEQDEYPNEHPADLLKRMGGLGGDT